MIEAASGLTETGLQAVKADVAQRKSRFQGNPLGNQGIQGGPRTTISPQALAKGTGLRLWEEFRRVGVSWDVIDAGYRTGQGTASS